MVNKQGLNSPPVRFTLNDENKFSVLKIVGRTNTENISDLARTFRGSRFVAVNNDVRLDTGPVDEQRTVGRHNHLTRLRNLGKNRFELMNRTRM